MPAVKPTHYGTEARNRIARILARAIHDLGAVHYGRQDYPARRTSLDTRAVLRVRLAGLDSTYRQEWATPACRPPDWTPRKRSK